MRSPWLAPTPPAVKQLASEMLWLMMLCPSNVGIDVKRNNVETIFGWSGQVLQDVLSAEYYTKYMGEAALSGIGSAGTAYNTGRWREFNYFINVAERLLALEPKQRAHLLDKPERFANWLEQIEENESRQLRHMFLYLFYPEHFERIFGGKDRRTIASRLLNIPPKAIKRLSAREVDAKLEEIRSKLETEYASKEMDFYVEPFRSLWNLSSPSVGNIAEPTPQYPASSNLDDKKLATNCIYYGPPGTGKTFKLSQLLNMNYTEVTHSEDYGVWLNRQLEPLNWMQIIVLCLRNLGGKATVNEIVNHNFYQRKALLNDRNKNLKATAWGCLQSYTVASSETVNYSNRREPAVFDKTNDGHWLLLEDKLDLVSDVLELESQLKSGPHKSERVERFSFVTFHQSYGYEEFIEGLRAETDEEGNISYAIKPGVFLQLCRRANADPEHRYAMIIDEINRGNISKIFGELITLIEADKRKDAKHPLTVTLPYSGDSFCVPSNVDIIGTMNTADRSLAMMDTALRRRFDFIEMMPEPELLSDVVVKGVDVKVLLETLNKRIETLYDREHTLGHAFFMPVKDMLGSQGEEAAFGMLKSVFQNKVLPLLQEYFFEDWLKISLVLADNQKPEHLQLVTESGADYDSLFGGNHNLNQYGQDDQRYQLAGLKEQLWDNPLTYQTIYAPHLVSSPELNQVG